MKYKDPTERLRQILPAWLIHAVEQGNMEYLEEIRVRAGRPVQLIGSGSEKLTGSVPDERMCERLLEELCENSVAYRERELAEGFITVNGCRIGVCGHAVWDGECIARYSHITGFNIRLAREVRGFAECCMDELYDGKGGVRSALVLSAPGSGKTTFLRDAARLLSNGTQGERGRKVCIADERQELAGAWGAYFDVGARTDVTCGCSKAHAMRALIRSMSPEIIVTDEIGSDEDAEAVLHAAASGVAVLASAHAGDEGEALKKPYLARLIRSEAFGVLIRLGRDGGDFTVRTVRLEGA